MAAFATRRKFLEGAVASATALAIASKAAADPVTHEVRITGFAFVPDRLEVRVGDTIRWINDDLAPHTATANEFGWDTGELVRQQSAELVVTAGIETDYFCVFHTHMKGKLVVI
jgi:plastocyanin